MSSGRVRTKSYHQGDVHIVRFAADGSYVLGADLNSVFLRGLDSNCKTTDIDPINLKQRVECLATSPTDRQLFAYTTDNLLYIARFKDEIRQKTVRRKSAE